jgi:hypothetical protein
VKRRLAIWLGAGLLLAPASAAASTTVGSSLKGRADLFTRCDAAEGACTEVQLNAGAAKLAVPTDGVITRWRVRAATLGGGRLRVLHRTADGSFTVVATSDWISFNRRHGPGADVLYEFPARITVQAGDLLALDRTRRAGGVFHGYAGDASWRAAQFDPLLPLDAAGLDPASTSIGRELLLNADVEADKDGDGFGDESQDNCPSIANDQTSNPCPRPNTGATGDGTGGPASGQDDEGTSTVIEAPRKFKRHRTPAPKRRLPSRAPRESSFG